MKGWTFTERVFAIAFGIGFTLAAYAMFWGACAALVLVT